ncbi:MAG: hypothetical protein LBM87_01980 [Ruminococcus sp.]|jgi:uncharacterized repeat protein (TIGR02543 family)|nr:hypothetical protein [Ruminococcus sp.]
MKKLISALFTIFIITFSASVSVSAAVAMPDDIIYIGEITGAEVNAGKDAIIIEYNFGGVSGEVALEVSINGSEYVSAGRYLPGETITYPVGESASYQFKLYGVSGEYKTLEKTSSVVNYVKPFDTPVLTAVGSSGAVSLTWTNIDGATSYDLYRGTSKNGNYEIIILGYVLSYEDTGRTNEQPYYYKIQAVSADNTSLISEPVQALPTEGHFGAYEYGENAATITIIDKSNDTVLSETVFLQGTVDRDGTLELSVNGVYEEVPLADGNFDVSFDLQPGRNAVSLYFEEEGIGYVTRKTFNFVYLTDYDMVVDASYSDGDTDVPTFTTVQEAIDEVPADNDEPVIIFIKNGLYEDRVVVDKPNVSLIGEDSESTIIYAVNNTALAGAIGGDMTERNVMKVEASAENFTAENFTVANTFEYTNGANQQADALAVFADKAIFVNLKLLSYQNTLLADSAGEGTIARQYFYKCYITGNLDVIYGRGTALFEDCEIKARYTSYRADGNYTAARTDLTTPYGFVFYDCRFTKEEGIADSSYYLARPWGADASAIFINSFVDSHINQQGYSDMSSNSYKNARFSESFIYGPGFVVNNDRPLINNEEAMTTLHEIFDVSSDSSDFNYDEILDDMYPPLAAPDIAIIWLVLPAIDQTEAEPGAVVIEEDPYDVIQCEMGETASLPTPVRDGYTFGGWYLDDYYTEGPVYELTPSPDDSYINNSLVQENQTFYVYVILAKFTEDTEDNNDNNNNNNNNNTNTNINLEDYAVYPTNTNNTPSDPSDTETFTSKSGITSTLIVTEDGVTVEAGVNKSGSVNSESTAKAVKKAAEIAKANGETSITVTIPAGAAGLSASTVKKLIEAADGMEITLELTSGDGAAGSISLPINAGSGQILTSLYFNTKRTEQIENYVANNWNTAVYGSFETAQKGGWGAVATIKVSLDKLGFEAQDGEKLYALIYDTKAKKWYEVPAEIIGTEVVIKTKRTGIITIVTDSVK